MKARDSIHVEWSQGFGRKVAIAAVLGAMLGLSLALYQAFPSHMETVSIRTNPEIWHK